MLRQRLQLLAWLGKSIYEWMNAKATDRPNVWMDKANNNNNKNSNNSNINRDRAICWPYTNRSATHIWPKQVDVCARGMAKSQRVGKTSKWEGDWKWNIKRVCHKFQLTEKCLNKPSIHMYIPAILWLFDQAKFWLLQSGVKMLYRLQSKHRNKSGQLCVCLVPKNAINIYENTWLYKSKKFLISTTPLMVIYGIFMLINVSDMFDTIWQFWIQPSSNKFFWIVDLILVNLCSWVYSQKSSMDVSIRFLVNFSVFFFLWWDILVNEILRWELSLI